MALLLEQFVKQLEDSGILAGETLKDFLPPKSEPKDATDLARELVRKKKLTRFQADEVSKGKGKSLVLGNYLLMEKIGAGGMGQVFKAEHRRMHRIVAVKVLPANTMKDPATVARFEREVTAAARISHPNIVAAHDADCANGVHFLVMELVEGSDLSALVKKNGPLPIDQAVNYIYQAAKGLEAAHAEGIVHRDIKPANLLLDKKGTVKILDMGLARIHGDAGQAELTASGAIMGTVDYMAPEQALNTKGADARADIYSLGCSLFYLLTGKATFDGDTLMAKLLAHRDQPIPVLRTLRPEVPDQLEAIFNKMVAKKIEDRYQTMTDVIAALEQCGGGQSINMPPSFQSSGTGLPTITGTPVLPKTADTPRSGKDNQKRLQVGGGIFGVVILLAGLVISLQTNDGTLVVEVNEPDAEVQVLNEEGKVEITRKGEKGPITISIDPGKHRLKVQKGGFDLFTKEFEIESGGKKTLTAKLLPVGAQPAETATEPLVAGAADSPDKLPAKFTNGLGMEFVLVGRGTAWLGGGNGQPGEKKVEIPDDFYLGACEVTQEEWEQVAGQTPSWFSRTGDGKDSVNNIPDADLKRFPVEQVSWDDVQAFLERLNKREQESGWIYRLPKADEWEYACRGGPLSDKLNSTYNFYSDKPTNELLPDQANFTPEPGNGLQRTCKVGSYQPNRLGLYDMHGNIFEWCDDEVKGEDGASFRVFRGGDWSLESEFCRAAARSADPTSSRYFNLGLRVARVTVGSRSK